MYKLLTGLIFSHGRCFSENLKKISDLIFFMKYVDSHATNIRENKAQQRLVSLVV